MNDCLDYARNISSLMSVKNKNKKLRTRSRMHLGDGRGNETIEDNKWVMLVLRGAKLCVQKW